ncbi:hypothetical protein DNFV4_03530 [Nitrospira tepida]|uniref:Uncharacterized protein n=1 Tax=Nitrospira tepida TaxID=2973512 RepID=A0AA86N1P9_9BACT|nr:hypothetical protein [Nitrospira tepida]CAI4033097.1 hypothetical protein DNFV4_03530 [Nitrospira tepida]
MDNRRHRYIPFISSAAAGLLVCLVISLVTGRKEAWDSEIYFSVGIPVMCGLIFALGYRFPERAWRWTLSMAVGQAIAMLSAGNSLSLWPLSIVAMTVLSVPQFVVGSVASRLATRKARA